MKPMLASDVVESRLVFPLIAQPKIDGVRALNMLGALTGRSLKKFKNQYVTKQFSVSDCLGLDGEMVSWAETDPDLCRKTSSALGTIKGEPWIMWWCFDLVTLETRDMPYEDRLALLEVHVATVRAENPALGAHLSVIPWRIVHNQEELDAYDDENLLAGFEGTCTRRMGMPHKQGRSTPVEGGLGRIKRFVEFEFRITCWIEGNANENEAQINELGQTFRSSHQANMVPNGMIGSMKGTVEKDVIYNGEVLFHEGQEVVVGAGRLTHKERAHYFKHPEDLPSKIGKAKFFPKGIKDKPRFPTFQSFRMPEDMS